MECLFDFLIDLIGVFSIKEIRKKSLFVRIITAVLLFVFCIGTIAFMIFVAMNTEDISIKLLLIAVAVILLIILVIEEIRLFF